MNWNSLIEPFRRFFRATRIWGLVLTLLALIWFDSKKWSFLGRWSSERRKARQQIRARWLTFELIQLGSAFIKLGQLLSARPDVLPAEWVIELAELQDKVPPFSFSKAQSVLEEELKDKCSEIIEIDEVPLGAASLAQVHRATLRNGRKVVLKIQRPGLQKLFLLDLQVMQKVALLLQYHPKWGKGRDWIGIAKECRRVLIRELDFQIEAQYAARFRQQFFDDSQVKVPGVIWELSTERVLCLDYLPGIKINDRKELIKAGINPTQVAEIGAASYLKQLVNFGFFHADPHPGNLAVAADGSLIYYDFGMMGLISNGLRKRIGSMIRSAAARDAQKLVSELQEAGLIIKGANLGPVRRLVRIMLQEALTPPFRPNVIERLSGDVYELVYGQPFRLPVELIFVIRALSTLEGVGRSLDPSFNLMVIARPYLIPLMTSTGSSGPNDLFNEIGRQVSELGNKAVTLPKRLDENLEKLEQGDLQLQVRMGESDRQFRRMVNSQQVTSQSILIGSLLISAAILSGNNQQNLAIFPLAAAVPVSINWFKMQLKLRRDNRIDQFPGLNK